MTEVGDNYHRVLERIHNAAARAGRDPESIRFIAVAKTVSPPRIREAVECGITDVGENRLQEALPKLDALRDLHLTWHFIGHVQTNKAKKVAESFQWVQSVDREDLAARLNQHTSPLPVLIEVKLQDEPAKSGVDVHELPVLIEKIHRFDRLDLRGLMAIPPFFENPDEVRPYFRRLRDLAGRFGMREISMGMSHDFEIAIEEGATMVRIGTAVFGARQ